MFADPNKWLLTLGIYCYFQSLQLSFSKTVISNVLIYLKSCSGIFQAIITFIKLSFTICAAKAFHYENIIALKLNFCSTFNNFYLLVFVFVFTFLQFFLFALIWWMCVLSKVTTWQTITELLFLSRWIGGLFTQRMLKQKLWVDICSWKKTISQISKWKILPLLFIMLYSLSFCFCSLCERRVGHCFNFCVTLKSDK